MRQAKQGTAIGQEICVEPANCTAAGYDYQTYVEWAACQFMRGRIPALVDRASNRINGKRYSLMGFRGGPYRGDAEAREEVAEYRMLWGDSESTEYEQRFQNWVRNLKVAA